MPYLITSLPHAFRPAGYWFWHSIPSRDQIGEQLADFAQAGFGTILIQARLAFPREGYLSSEFLSAYRLAAEIAMPLDLKLGLYDDYNWMSGQAGGRTVKGRDDLREQHLFWSTTSETIGEISEVRSPFFESLGPDIAQWLYENGELAWSGWTIVAALQHQAGAVGLESSVRDVTNRVTLLGNSVTGCRYTLAGTITEGCVVTVFIRARAHTSRLINYLLPEAGERFVAVGLAPFAAALQGLMPDPVRQVFFDQPSPGFYRWDQHYGNLGNSLLYDDSFRRKFEVLLPYPFALALLSLVIDVGPRTRLLRCAFYELYADTMHHGFLGAIAGWAAGLGLETSGHEILAHVGAWGLNQGFRSIDPRVAIGVDHFGVDDFRTETAVDANNFEAQLSPKLGDSIARAHGRTRCAVEIYATSLNSPVRASGQWGLTLATLRAQSIRLCLLGARQIIVHALWQTDGHAGDNRPFINPRFDFAPGINFEPWWPYTAQYSREIAQLSAFIEPAVPLTRVAVLYAVHTAWAEGPQHAHGRHLGEWCRHLTALGCDYLIVDEASVRDASIEDGRLAISGCHVDAIVLPSMSTLKSVETLKRLSDLQSEGIRIWVSGDAPHALESAGTSPSSPDADAYYGDAPSFLDIEALVGGMPPLGPRLDLPPSLWRWLGRDHEGWWRVILFNDGEAAEQVALAFDGAIESERWNPWDGTVAPLELGHDLTFQLEPQVLTCLRIRPAERPASPFVLATMTVTVATTLDEAWTLISPRSNKPMPIAVDRGWEVQGLAAFSGIGRYQRSIEIEQAGWFHLLLPSVHTAVTVSLDGEEIARLCWPPYRIELGLLQPGLHVLELAVANTAANHYYADTSFRGDHDEPSGIGATPCLIRLVSSQ